MSPARFWISKRYRPTLLVLAVYGLLSLGLTYPLLFHLTTAVPSDIGDPLLNTWILAWDGHALLSDPRHLFDANIFYPLPNTLAYSEHLLSTALLALPVQLVAGEPLLAYNLSLLASFPLTGLGMYLLAMHWTGRREAAFMAGLIFAFNPYRFAAIAHLQLLTYQWLPLALLALDRLATGARTGQRPVSPVRWGLALVIFLLLQLLASWYLALYSLVILAIYGLALLLARRFTRPGLARLGLAGLACAGLILPLAWPYLALAQELQAARPLSLALSLAAAPADILAAAPFNRFFGPLTAALRDRPGFTEENTLFPGVVPILLALAALAGWLRSARPVPRLTLYALLFSLLLSLALTLAGPFSLLARLMPVSTIVRVPPRWIIPALFALAGLATFGFAGLSRPSRLPVLLGTLLVVAESLSVPLPLAPVANRANLNPAYGWLAARPGPLALVELPLHSAPAPEYPEVKRLYASTLGWWKLVNGYSGYTPPRQPELARALSGFPDPMALAALQALAGPPAGRPLYLLVHPGEAPLDRAAWETGERWVAQASPALWPVAQFEGDYLYRVLPVDPGRFAGPPQATFGPGIELLAVKLPGLAEPASGLALYWRSTASLATSYTVFIHFRAPDGFIQQQADGPPVGGHYLTPAWPPGQVIQDIHSLPPLDAGHVDHLAIGLYDPATGERLPAYSPAGERLPEDALLIPMPSATRPEAQPE